MEKFSLFFSQNIGYHKCLVYAVGVMPALPSALGLGKTWQTLFRARTRRICAVFPKHGLSVIAIRIVTLAMGVAVSKVFLDLVIVIATKVNHCVNNFRRFFYNGQ